MAFTALTSGQCDANSPLDETLLQLVRTNFDDHESRIKSVEDPNVRVFEHFARTKFYSSNEILVATGATYVASRDYADNLIFRAAGSGTFARWVNRYGVAVGNDAHFVRAQDVGTLQLICAPGYYFTNRTKPIVFKFRMMIENYNDWTGFFFGLMDVPPAEASTTRPSNGLFMEMGATAGTFRFVARNGGGGSETVGTEFTRPSSSAWFTFEITFTNDPSNQAVCKIDGVTKETLTTNLPTAKTLFPVLHLVGSVASTKYDLDRIEAYASGALSDAA
jgi:hypothetical protein